MFGRKLVVAHHRPVRRPLLALVVLALLVVVALVAYVYGTATLSIKFRAVRAERDRLGQEVTALEEESRELRERLAIVERAGQIDRKAYGDLDQHLLRLQEEIYGLKEEVAFYRSIVSSSRQRGLHIQSFDLRPESGSVGYRYQLVLTHDMKSDKVISGTVNVSVVGKQDGEPREFAPGSDADIVFKFKHFQRIEGRIFLPDGFSPQSVTVQVIGADADETMAERTFNWPRPVS